MHYWLFSYNSTPQEAVLFIVLLSVKYSALFLIVWRAAACHVAPRCEISSRLCRVSGCKVRVNERIVLPCKVTFTQWWSSDGTTGNRSAFSSQHVARLKKEDLLEWERMALSSLIRFYLNRSVLRFFKEHCIEYFTSSRETSRGTV